VAADAELDGGDQDCGSGLLLSLTAAMRRLDVGQVLRVRTRERSVTVDLPAWARLASHDVLDVRRQDATPVEWSLWVRRGGPAPAPAVDFSSGEAVPLGERLWLYSNFHCNLACDYCCSESSPQAAARLLPAGVAGGAPPGLVAAAAVKEFAGLGGRELLVTGGEPFLHPELGEIVRHAGGHVPVTILTNAMVFSRGTRRSVLEAMDRSRVTLQVSLDSGSPQLHDRLRGKGSHARAVAGIRLARELGFRVRVAATLYPSDLEEAGPLHALCDDLGVAADDRLLRPVANEGAADSGVHISLDTVEPEPTLAVDGAWWHPVGVTNSHLRVSPDPLPVEHVLDVMRDVLAVQAAGNAAGRSVFRCT
jgi:TusA-related sulfurtransferase/pyruvate-formate lyase-activating enzyme